MVNSNLILILLMCLFAAIFVYLLFHRVGFKMILRSLRGSTRHKYGFYECGYRPRHEYGVKFNMHAFIICSMALLYDVESLFLFIFILNLDIISIIDLFILIFYLSTFFVGFALEFITGSSEWHFY